VGHERSGVYVTMYHCDISSQ